MSGTVGHQVRACQTSLDWELENLNELFKLRVVDNILLLSLYLCVIALYNRVMSM
jgi:hypothetical protein